MVAACLRILGLGAVLSAVSEIWFYPVDFGPQLAELAIYYGILGYAAWLVLAQFGAAGLAAGYLGASLMGFLVEGVPVPVLYHSVPFTLVWTSLAWHAVLTVAVGLWLFRRVMARSRTLVQILFCTGFGVYLGCSTVELWAMPQDGDPWVWPDPLSVWSQFIGGWAIFVAGHLMLNATAGATVRPAPWALPFWAGIVTVMFLVQNAFVWFPVSLVLPVLVAVTVLPVWRARLDRPSAVLVRLTQSTVPICGVIVSLLIPLAATTTLWGLAQADLRLEGSAFHILWAGPVSVGLFIWAVVSVWRGGKAGGV